MSKIPLLLNINLDRAKGIAATRYHLSKDYLPSVVRRALPMHLGSKYRFTFTLKTSKGVTTTEVPAIIKVKRIPSPSGSCVCYEPEVVGIPEDKGYPNDFYASQVVEIAQRSIEFINSILSHIRYSHTPIDAAAKAAIMSANKVRAGEISNTHEPCVERALRANAYDIDLNYRYMRHGLIVGDIFLDATVCSYIDKHDRTATLTTHLVLSN